MNNKRIFFGTDGIRGKVGTGFLTPDFTLELGRAAGTVFSGKEKILIARDTRLSGGMLQAALSSGICSTGVSVCDLGILPTPACAYLTKYLNAQAGMVISASHNPYYDNGIKIFNSNGSKLTDNQESSIENIVLTNRENAEIIMPNRIGHVEVDESLYRHYVDYCIEVFNSLNTSASINTLKKLKVVVDCSNGSTYKVAPEILQRIGLDFKVLNVEPNGFNINQECGAADSKGLELLAKKVKLLKADLGIALDGDGDRVILVDAKGNVIDGDQILFILANDYLETKKSIVGVVGTQMSNLGLEQALRNRGIDFIRTKVGDRYVLEKLHEKNWVLGGETSGHILSLDKSTTGDGIITALMVLSAMARAEKTLHELISGFHKFPQAMVNVILSSDKEDREKNKDILEAPTVKEAITEIINQLNGKGRVLVRPSGTEPLLRVMVEGERTKEVHSLANKLSEVIRAEIKV